MLLKRFVVVGSVLLAYAFVGCGPGGPEIAEVEGKVTMDGKPLANAAVVFVPENGRPAGAMTNAEGFYVLNFDEGREGAIPGMSIVRISTLREAQEGADGKMIPASPETVPARYNVQTELKYDVKKGERNVANFDLKSGGAVAKGE